MEWLGLTGEAFNESRTGSLDLRFIENFQPAGFLIALRQTGVTAHCSHFERGEVIGLRINGNEQHEVRIMINIGSGEAIADLTTSAPA
jgi:hypothetical protein